MKHTHTHIHTRKRIHFNQSSTSFQDRFESLPFKLDTRQTILLYVKQHGLGTIGRLTTQHKLGPQADRDRSNMVSEREFAD